MQKVIRNLKEENAEQKDYIENRLEKDFLGYRELRTESESSLEAARHQVARHSCIDELRCSLYDLRLHVVHGKPEVVCPEGSRADDRRAAAGLALAES